MLASIKKSEDGFIAQFDRSFNYTIEKVWAALTENEQLAHWMSNLGVEDLRKGGNIKFDMKDGTGTYLDLKILDYQPNVFLEFEWGKDRVRFELFSASEGCQLLLSEFIPILTDPTSRDLAGWHVCLNVFSALLEGRLMDFPKADWDKWHEQYIIAVSQAG